MSDLVYSSPCKFNLYLEIREARPDGYHEVVTVIEPLYLLDRLILREIPRGIEVTSSRPDVPSGKGNIVYRAIELFQAETGVTRGVSIHIEKNIPPAAGLGGGSGNAAATLLELNRLWDLRLPPRKLLEISSRLGSDVPFFLNPKTSLCRGRGEIIAPLTAAPPFWAALLNPGVPVSTRWAYDQIDREPVSFRPRLDPVLKALEEGDLAALGRAMHNGFQEAISRRVAPVKILLDFLRSQEVLGAILAGSGGTVVGVTRTEEEARAVARRAGSFFPGRLTSFVASNINPLAGGNSL